METTTPAALAQPQEQEQEQEQEQAWQGAVEAALPSTQAAAAWPHLASFCALHRYLSGVDVCERVAGEDGRPGCVRHVASSSPGPAGADKEATSWAREELLALDDAARRLSYAVVGSNMGFGRYVATMSVHAEERGSGCRLVWEFECDPVRGWSRDGLVAYLDAALKGMADRIQAAAAANE